MTPLAQGLPSPAIMLFNHPIRGIMWVINRLPFGIDNDDEHHKAIIKRQTKNDKDKDTSKNVVSLPMGSTVVVQYKDGGPWTHGMIEGKCDCNHHNRSYIICITKTGRLVTWSRQHIKPTQVSAEQYLCVQLQKHTKKDQLDNIPTQIEKQQMATNIINNTDNGPHSINTHDHTTADDECVINQRKGEEKIGQKISINKTPGRGSSDYKGRWPGQCF